MYCFAGTPTEISSRATFGGVTELADEASRAKKAEKIKAVLEQEGVLPDQSLRILDIGCSFGIILKSLVPYAEFGVGIDIDRNLLGNNSDKIMFVLSDGENLPFPTSSFDIVICNHVYEHTDHPERMLTEIERVLTLSGVCYFAGPNKYDLIEPHYGLPLLSWLPRSIADRYLQITGKGNSYTEKPYSYPALQKILKKFEVIDYTERIICDPVRYSAADMLPPGSFKQRVASLLFKMMPFFFPGYVLIFKSRPHS